jgi:anti-sigma factor RsiW
MTCPRKLDVQAYMDGETDAGTSAEIERHLLGCAECAALQDDINVIRAGMRSVRYHAAGEQLRARVRRDLDRETATVIRPSPAFWKGAASGIGATALAACLALSVMWPRPQDVIAHDVVTAHLRSLMASHLVDVASSDHHTVRPWFDGRIDIAPPADDFTQQGFRLVGGRLDYIDGRRAAVVVYRHGAHVVNVFAWKNDGAATPGLHSRNGYTLLAWKKGDLFYCAVSDTSAAELRNLQKLMLHQA